MVFNGISFISNFASEIFANHKKFNYWVFIIIMVLRCIMLGLLRCEARQPF